MGNYKTVEGMKLDAQLLDLAEKSVKGQGDGRISAKDAETLFARLREASGFAQVEQDTVTFIRDHFKWTDSAAEWFNERINALLHRDEPPKDMTPAELSKQHFPTKDVLDSDDDRNSRHHDLRSATAETYQDHDEIAIIVQLLDGHRVKVLSNFIELEGSIVELKGGYTIPVRAIQKVEV